MLFNVHNRNNPNESSFWFLVEILNNNNKSIFLFLIILFILFIIFIKNKESILVVYKSIINFLFLFGLFLYNVKNINLFISFKKEYIINNNLINGIVLIHPILVYITYILLVITIINYTLNKKYFNYISLFINKHKNVIFILSFSALILGGW